MDYEYQGLPIKGITEKAYREMAQFGLSLMDVEKTLQEGVDCPGVKRRKAIVERCIRKDRKVLKVVVEKMVSWRGYPYWRVRHVGLAGGKL